MAKKKNNGENSGGNKAVAILITVLILITFFSVMALLIKLDVGGFGSNVLRPVFKDVPVINQILPPPSDEEIAKETDYPYKTLEAAINHITEQDEAIGSKDAEIAELNDKVNELSREVNRLKEYESDQKDFEDKKIKFYNEIVYGESAPDTDTYIEWYNQLDAEYAEEIYKKLLASREASKEIKDLAASYEEMDAKSAAGILESMKNDLDTVALILNNMSASARGEVLAQMSADFAASVTKKLLP